MGKTLNNMGYKSAVIAMIIVAACAIVATCLFGMAEASFIGDGAGNLLQDLGKVVALAGVGMGVFNIVKGRMVMGIIVILVAAVLYVFCGNPQLFQQFGQKIVGIF